MTKPKIILIIFFSIISIMTISSCDIIDEMFGRSVDEVNDISNISQIEVEYLIDNATYSDGSINGTSTGLDNQGEFTSDAGTSTYSDKVYQTTFNNPPVLGKKITGEMKITFSSDNKKVNVYLDQFREWNYIDGWGYNSSQTYKISCNNIPYNKSYIDDFDEDDVDEYYFGGSALNGIIDVTYSDNRIWGTDGHSYMIGYSCGNRAYIKVKVHYE